MTERTLTAPETAAGARVDTFVGEALGLSRAKLKALFEEGSVRVDGRRVKKGETLSAGAVVTVQLAAESLEAPTAKPDPSMALTVLYEDEAIIVVDKPAGVPSQPQAPGELGTIANALSARAPKMLGASADPREAGLCHRLDIETSGVLLAAKTRAAWERLRKAFSTSGLIDKRYLALTYGPLADEGDIEVPLEHHGATVRATLEGVGREAKSAFKVLRRRGAYSLVEVQIATGVLHQVRAHLAGIGAPIVDDTLYGGPSLGLGRFFLHASSLELPHPTTGSRLRVESPLPDELGAWLFKVC